MRYLPFLFMLSFSTHIFAADSGCHEVSSMEQRACLEQEFAIADKTLNLVYKEQIAKQPHSSNETPDKKKAFISAQRAWLNYRDAQCGYESLQGGNVTWQSIFSLTCKTNLTIERTKWLKIQ